MGTDTDLRGRRLHTLRLGLIDCAKHVGGLHEPVTAEPSLGCGER
jgi:hypothetical protein